MRKILIERTKELMELFNTLYDYTVVSCSELSEALSTMEKFRPDIVVFTEKAFNSEPLKVCRMIREKYSLLVPVILLLNFYTSLDIAQLKALGIRTLVKPCSEEELREILNEVSIKPKIQYIFEDIVPQETEAIKMQEAIPSVEEKVFSEQVAVTVEEPTIQKEELREIIRQEVRNELKIILRQILEDMEKYA